MVNPKACDRRVSRVTVLIRSVSGRASDLQLYKYHTQTLTTLTDVKEL